MSTNFIVSHAQAWPLYNLGQPAPVVRKDENKSQSQISEQDMRTYLNQRREFEKMERCVAETKAMFFAPPLVR